MANLRRQQKIASIIKQTICRAVLTDLDDPRIDGFVSVTKVDLSPDLRNANISLSIFAKTPASENKTFMAIKAARSKLQGIIARTLDIKFCPIIEFHLDMTTKKAQEIISIIDKANPDPDRATLNNSDSDAVEDQDG